MNEQETSHYGIQAVLRAATCEDFESKIGGLEYSIGKYERLIRATVPTRFFGSDENEESKSFYLLLSFDLKSNVIDIIEIKLYHLYGSVETTLHTQSKLSNSVIQYCFFIAKNIVCFGSSILSLFW